MAPADAADGLNKGLVLQDGFWEIEEVPQVAQKSTGHSAIKAGQVGITHRKQG